MRESQWPVLIAPSAVVVARCRKDSLSPVLETFGNLSISIHCLAGVKNILDTMQTCSTGTSQWSVTA